MLTKTRKFKFYLRSFKTFSTKLPPTYGILTSFPGVTEECVIFNNWKSNIHPESVAYSCEELDSEKTLDEHEINKMFKMIKDQMESFEKDHTTYYGHANHKRKVGKDSIKE